MNKATQVTDGIKDVCLGEVAIPQDAQQAIHDITVLMFHLKQVKTELFLIMERHDQLLVAAIEDDCENEFYDKICSCMSIGSGLYSNIVDSVSMGNNSYLCSDE